MKLRIGLDSAYLYGIGYSGDAEYEVDDQTSERWVRIEAEYNAMQKEIDAFIQSLHKGA